MFCERLFELQVQRIMDCVPDATAPTRPEAHQLKQAKRRSIGCGIHKKKKTQCKQPKQGANILSEKGHLICSLSLGTAFMGCKVRFQVLGYTFIKQYFHAGCLTMFQ
jgi:hypothetical protein